MPIDGALWKGIHSIPDCLSVRSARARSPAVALLLTFFFSLCSTEHGPSFLQEASAAERPVLRLRIAWGGGAPQAWSGSLSVSEGRIVKHDPLGIDEDAPGSMWIDRGTLQVEARSQREYDGVDVDIVAPLESNLIVSLKKADAQEASASLEIPLRDLVDDSFHRPLGPTNLGNQILVQRVPGDRLRVKVKRDSLVFAPNEQLELELLPHLLGLPANRNVVLRSQVVVARTEDEISASSKTFSVPVDEQNYESIPLEFSLPEDEGVYDLVFTVLLSEDGFARANPFRNREQVIARRKVQCVVVGSRDPGESATTVAAAPGKIVTEILPTNPWWKKVGSMSGLRGGPLRHGNIQLWQHPSLGAHTRLAPSPTDEETVWVAYPLTVAQPGLPHILQVDYPNDLPQSMGISILEPDAAGNLLPVGIDSGVVVRDRENQESPAVANHEIVFWPKTKSPYVLITNARKDKPAIHGTIRLRGPRSASFPSLQRADPRDHRLPPLIAPTVSEGDRLFAGYMAEPLLPENFSALEFLDTETNRSLDDWVTFYQSGRRLIEYLKYGGYNALVFSVLARGGAIYPSDRLEATPRYDTGVFASSGQDPIRKDVLELLLRLCDREGIQLIPALQLSTPLPHLEEKRRTRRAATTGMILADAEGRLWQDRAVQGGQLRYNPLHADVQAEVLQITRELVDRYGDHPSFAGIAIDTSGRGCTVFPGPAWGADPLTYKRFLQQWEAQQHSEAAEGTTNTATAMDERTTWLKWRADQLRTFHGRIADQLRVVCPKGKLFVATSAIEVSPDVADKLRPALPNQFTPDELLLGVGLSTDNYKRVGDGVVLLRSRVMETDFSRIDPSAASEVGRSLQWDQPFEGLPALGHFLQSRPRAIRLASFDQQSPFGAEATYVSLVPHLVPTGARNRELLVRDLATRDLGTIMVGGSMLPLGQEESLRSVVTTYRRLPKDTFVRIEGDHEPVVLRKLVKQGSTYLSLANPTPWPCRVTFRVPQEPPLEIENLSLAGAPKVSDGLVQISLTAHDFRALRFSRADVNPTTIEVKLASDVATLLERRINELADRTSQLKTRREREALKNSNFESPESADRVIGWTSDRSGTVALDPQHAHTGQSSLRIQNTAAETVVRSNRFAAPGTGRLSFFVWLKMSKDFEGPLRMGIEGEHQENTFYRYGEVPTESEWKMFEYQITDLPLSGLGPIAIRFEHRGRGDVWIDDVVVSELYFSENERKELSRILTQAHFALTGGKYAECNRILNSYWPQFLQQHVSLPNPEGAVQGPIDRPEELSRVPVTEANIPSEEQPWWKKFPNLLR
ncbi:MAG: family 10 glycosylhydrolase [Pirellulales bacterium]|nr:family 10 glycosylhydrolase [Pirellulales bacterium]